MAVAVAVAATIIKAQGARAVAVQQHLLQAQSQELTIEAVAAVVLATLEL
jgi:hypothetical protein